MSAEEDPLRPEDAATGPLDLLAVGWFPSGDDLMFGRFIADQVAALAATGRVRPAVVSFEPFWLHGDWYLRWRTARAWPAIVRSAAGSGILFAPEAANGAAGISVARIGAPAGRTLGTGAANEAIHRARALWAALTALPNRPWRLLHAHVGYPEGAAVADVAQRMRLPFVLTEHATYLDRLWADPAIRGRYRSAAGAAARVIAVGRVLADQIEGEFPELRGHVLVVPNTVDIAAFRPSGPAERDPDELLWVGYRREVKGMTTLLRAFALVREQRPATRLRLIGRSTTDEEEQGWHVLAAQLGVGDAVSFEDPADRAGVAAAMARAACFVHPSNRETMGIVAVEALASGLPVVATDSGGVSEVLGSDPAALGALVPQGDPPALAAAILETLQRRASFAPQRLRATVELRYAAPAVADRLADIYEEVLAEGPSDSVDARPPRSARVTWHGAQQRLTDRVVVVGFDRPHLERDFPKAPAWATDGAIVVTRGEREEGFAEAEYVPIKHDQAVLALLAGGPTVSRPRTLLDLLAWPFRWIRRLRARWALERRTVPLLDAAVSGALDRIEASRETPALLVGLGGIDVFVAARATRTGRAIMAPGGLRWLEDVRWNLSPGKARPRGTERPYGSDRK